MKFKIYGVSRDSGKEVELVLEADTKEAAEKAAYELNILVYVQKTQAVVEHEIKAATPVVRREEEQSNQVQNAQSPQQLSSQQSLPTLNVNVKSNSNSLGIASIILGILAFLICWIPFVGVISILLGGIGAILGIIGLVLSMKRSGSGIGYPIAGLAINGLSIGVALLITGALASAFDDINNQTTHKSSQGSIKPDMTA